MMKMNNDLIFSRRSIRKFSDYYVKDDEIKEIIKAAQYAPSWCNMQESYFMIIRDDKIINNLSTAVPSYNPGHDAIKGSNCVILALYKKDKIGYYGKMDFNIVGTWAMFDLGMACQNISLKAHELGLGSVIVGAYDFDMVENMLNISGDYQFAAIIPIGKRIENPVAPKRKDMEEIIIK